MSASLTLLKSALRPITEFIYPPTCFVCEVLMENSESRMCSECWSSIKPVNDGDQLFREMHSRLTGEPASHISNLISLYHFEKEGTLQSIIHQLKYEGMTSLGVELGRMLGEKLRFESDVESIRGIIPVPLHPTKLRERGYNQSEYIAKGIRDATGISVYTSLVKRQKYTSSQTKLNITERKENVGDAFDVSEQSKTEIQGKTFLIVDDVITTGATIEACAAVLMKNGARSVVAGSVAIADHAA